MISLKKILYCAVFALAITAYLPLASSYLEKPKAKEAAQKPVPQSNKSDIKLTAKGSHGYLLRDAQEDFYILVSLKTPKRHNTKNLPLNVAIVIDRSGSMADKGKLNFAKQAAKDFINKLKNEDRVSIVEYDDKVTVLVEPTVVGKNRSELTKKINLLEPRGSTNLAGGMMEGGKLIEKYFADNRVNRVLLLSDGLANTGVSDVRGVSALAEGLSRKGIQVTTFGLGADFDEEMMTKIADISGGNYYFIESSAQIVSIFEKERNALSTVVGKKVVLTLDLSNQVKVAEVYGYPFKKKGDKITIKLPDIFSGQKRKILIRLTPKIKEAHKIDVAKVTLDYQSVDNDLRKQTLSQVVVAKTTTDRSVFEKSANSDVMVESVKIASASHVEEAMKSYSAGDSAKANSLLGRAKKLLQNGYSTTSSPMLLNQMKDLDKTKRGMSAQSADSEAGKIFIKSNKYDSRQKQQSY